MISEFLEFRERSSIPKAYWSHRDLQAYRLSDGPAASHGACKPCSELGLSQEP